MDIKTKALIFVLLYTVHCSPTKSNDFDMDDDHDYQNEETYGDADYEGSDDAVEESKMPVVPLKIRKPTENKFERDIGDSVTLPCEIEGSNYVQIWRKKNYKVQDAVLFQSGIRMSTAPNVKLLPNGALEISNLHVQDGGIYECIAMETQQHSPHIEYEVNLRVPPLIESLTVKNNVTVLRSGEALVLTCKAHGYPKPVISWHKGSSRFEVEGEVFQIEQVRHHDAGTYKCLADNKIGEPAFSHIDIKVEFKPVITIEKVVVSSENNSETELECLVHSEPRAAVVWLKDGEDVANTQRTQLVTNEHKHNLILKDLRESDFGVYTCLATNSLGSSQKNISLVRTPAVHRFRKTQTDAKVVLSWDVQSRSDLAEHELLYKRKGESDWKSLDAELKPEVSSTGKGLYEVKYTVIKGLEPGDYETKFRSRNYKGWSPEYVSMMTVDVYAKHGHHKSHKKGHKHGKDKQTTPTPTLPPYPEEPAEHQEADVKSGSVKQSSSTEKQATPTPTLPSQPELPTEHQEVGVQSDSMKESAPPGTESTNSSPISSRTSPISIALFAFLQVRLLASIRI